MPLLSKGVERGRFPYWVIAVVIVGCAAISAAQQLVDDPDSVLQRSRERLRADLERFPRYTCVQTITRKYYRARSEGASCSTLMAEHNESPPAKLRFRSWDRLRLEVAIAGHDNVYSWVGAARFESGTIEQLAGRGPFNTGDFGPFLSVIFNRGSMNFAGEELVDEQRTFAYTYEVPLEESTYQVKDGDGWTATAYKGKFFLNPLTADIVRLTVSTAELPLRNPDCQAISRIDYGRTDIHDRMVLIPRQTSLVTLGRNGEEAQSQTMYSSCREYASKTRMLIDGSSVHSTAGAIDRAAGFGVAGTEPASRALPGTQSPQTSGVMLSALPAGLHLRLRISTVIDSDSAAAGDPIEAVLRSAVRDRKHQLLVPAGARLRGRLLDVEQRLGGFDHFRLAIQFESIDLNGQAVPLRASPDLSASPSHTLALPISVINDNEPNAATSRVFIIAKQDVHLEKLDWGWTTTELEPTPAENHAAAGGK